MKTIDILRHRLKNQQLIDSQLRTPAEIVSWLGAVQSQDYPAAKWALGLRLPGSVDATINNAFNEGSILRTHVMRPTWHFVHPRDIRWLLKLTAPRVHAIMAYYTRTLGLDAKIFTKTNSLIVALLQGHNYLTRAELSGFLKKSGIDTTEQRVGFILTHAELEGVVCSGPLKGKQFTYALLEERAPQAKAMDRDEALVELTKRYFTSHGPATVKDFVWWSGLTMVDAKKGLEMNKSTLLHEEIDGKIYWFASSSSPARDISQTGYLLPNYDEYTIGYKDREAFLDSTNNKGIDSRGNVIFNHSIVIGGKIVGGWRRILKKDSVEIIWEPFISFTAAEKEIFIKAANNFGKFLGLPVTFTELH